jgi:hypothetical protein
MTLTIILPYTPFLEWVITFLVSIGALLLIRFVIGILP